MALQVLPRFCSPQTYTGATQALHEETESLGCVNRRSQGWREAFSLDSHCPHPSTRLPVVLLGVVRSCHVRNVFADSKCEESFAHFFQTLAFGLAVLLVAISLIENRSGTDDLATILTIRRPQMQHVIKGMDFITQWRLFDGYDPLSYFSKSGITEGTMLTARDRV